MLDDAPLTIGIDHVGLAVRDVALSRGVFCECIGCPCPRLSNVTTRANFERHCKNAVYPGISCNGRHGERCRPSTYLQ